MSSLVTLAEDILRAGLSDPSFDNDLVVSVPLSLQEHRNTLIDKTDQLNRLSLGVKGHANEITFAWAAELSLRFVYKYHIANLVPLEGSCSYASLAEATGLSEQMVQRHLRHAMGNYIFAQTPDGQVRHTALTRQLATDPIFEDATGYQLMEMGPGSVFALEALDRFGDSGEQKETGWALYNQALKQKDDTVGPLQSVFQALPQDPGRAKVFGSAMRYYTTGASQDLTQLLVGFDWASVDKPGSLFVDLGGGHGITSQYLAQNTKQLRFVVQDRADSVREGAKMLPTELHGRVHFEVHDFFCTQERKADIYLTRWIFHNWSDKYAVKILKNLVPAMKDGARVILFEYLMRDEPENLVTRKHGANLDMVMLATFNGIERTAENFRRVFREADERFVVESITRPTGNLMALVNVVWKSPGLTQESHGLTEDSKGGQHAIVNGWH